MILSIKVKCFGMRGKRFQRKYNIKIFEEGGGKKKQQKNNTYTLISCDFLKFKF